jgi:hypothetical protein
MAQGTSTRIINGREFYIQPRNYSVVIVRSAAVSGVFTGTIQIDPQRPFLLLAKHIDDDADGLALTTQNYFKVTVQTNANGRQWSNNPEPRTAHAGDRIWGRQMGSEVFIPANLQVNITLTNAAAGGPAPVAGNTTYTLIGYDLVDVQAYS